MPPNQPKSASDSPAGPANILDRAPARILRLKAVQDMVGLRKAALYRLKRIGSFPEPIKLGARAVGWLEEDVLAWIAGRTNRNAKRSGREAGAHPVERTPTNPRGLIRRSARAPSIGHDEELKHLRAIARRVRRIHRLQAELARLLNEPQDM